MPSLKMNLPGMFNNILRAIQKRERDQYACCLEELERHLRETIRGERTLQEFAEFYYLADELPPPVQTSADPCHERD